MIELGLFWNIHTYSYIEQNALYIYLYFYRFPCAYKWFPPFYGWMMVGRLAVPTLEPSGRPTLEFLLKSRHTNIPQNISRK